MRIRKTATITIASMLLIAGFLVLAMLLGTSSDVLAEKTSDALTSNIKQAMTSSSDRSKDHAQEFTTGANSSGYGLTSLDIAFANATLTNGAVANQPEVSLWVRNPHPDVFSFYSTHWLRLARWDRPSAGTPANGEFILSYDLPQHLHLEPSTVYRVAVGKDSSMSMAITKYVADSGSPGWLIGNRLKTRSGFNEYTNTAHDADGQPAVGKISLHGYPSNPAYPTTIIKGHDACPYQCRVAANGDWIIGIMENQPGGLRITELGLNDSDPTVGEKSSRVWIEYAPEEAIDDYVLVAENSILFTGITFDYETQQEHNFVIKVYDLHEHTITTQKVVLDITDLTDIPVDMTGVIKPVVEKDSATAGKRDTTVCWTAPFNVGRPMIDGYDIRYRESSSEGWTEISRVPGDQCLDDGGALVYLPVDGSDDAEGIGHTIVGLTPNTAYTIQIRAINSSGFGPWGKAQFNTDYATAQRLGVPTPEPQPPNTPVPTATPAPQPTPEPPLTAEFRSVPASHNGSDPVAIELHFSEHVSGLSYAILRDEAFQTTNSRVITAGRLVSGSNQSWVIRVEPLEARAMTIALARASDCGAVGAICMLNGKKLSNSIQVTIPHLGS